MKFDSFAEDSLKTNCVIFEMGVEDRRRKGTKELRARRLVRWWFSPGFYAFSKRTENGTFHPIVHLRVVLGFAGFCTVCVPRQRVCYEDEKRGGGSRTKHS